MRAAALVAAVLLVGLSAPARAQVASARPLPSFAASTSRPVPSQVKWGMLIGGVTGTAIGAIVVARSSSHCQKQNERGWDCLLRPIVFMGGAAAGGLVGMLAGGAIGKSIAEHAEFDVAGASLKMGVRLPL